MRRTMVSTVVMLASVSMVASAQQWTAEEQEVLDHIRNCWDAGPDWDRWEQVCNPADDVLYWWTTENSPAGNNWWRPVNEEFYANNTVIASDIRPVRIRFFGEVAAVYFFGLWQSKNADGVITTQQEVRLELFRKVDDRWQFLGGMGGPVAPDPTVGG